MSLVDPPAEQERRIAQARAVRDALDALSAFTYPEGDEKLVEDVLVADARLRNWLEEQPAYVLEGSA
jgi:hypothetical protein